MVHSICRAPPSFTPGPDVTVNENSGPAEIPAWATDIQAGELGEQEEEAAVGLADACRLLESKWTA